MEITLYLLYMFYTHTLLITTYIYMGRLDWFFFDVVISYSYPKVYIIAQ